jgi:hypothetical protein
MVAFKYIGVVGVLLFVIGWQSVAQPLNTEAAVPTDNVGAQRNDPFVITTQGRMASVIATEHPILLRVGEELDRPGKFVVVYSTLPQADTELFTARTDLNQDGEWDMIVKGRRSDGFRELTIRFEGEWLAVDRLASGSWDALGLNGETFRFDNDAGWQRVDPK